MPLWLSILLAIISNIPSIIRAIQEIIALIKRLPIDKQAHYHAALKTVALGVLKDRGSEAGATMSNLRELKSEIQAHLGFPHVAN